jgi:hypothetical protein
MHMYLTAVLCICTTLQYCTAQVLFTSHQQIDTLARAPPVQPSGLSSLQLETAHPNATLPTGLSNSVFLTSNWMAQRFGRTVT